MYVYIFICIYVYTYEKHNIHDLLLGIFIPTQWFLSSNKKNGKNDVFLNPGASTEVIKMASSKVRCP